MWEKRLSENSKLFIIKIVRLLEVWYLGKKYGFKVNVFLRDKVYGFYKLN